MINKTYQNRFFFLSNSMSKIDWKDDEIEINSTVNVVGLDQDLVNEIKSNKSELESKIDAKMDITEANKLLNNKLDSSHGNKSITWNDDGIDLDGTVSFRAMKFRNLNADWNTITSVIDAKSNDFIIRDDFTTYPPSYPTSSKYIPNMSYICYLIQEIRKYVDSKL